MPFHPFPPTELDRLLAADPIAEAASRAVRAAAREQTTVAAPGSGNPASFTIPWGKLEATAAAAAILLR